MLMPNHFVPVTVTTRSLPSTSIHDENVSLFSVPNSESRFQLGSVIDREIALFLPQKENRLSAENLMVGEVGLEPTRIATPDPTSREWLLTAVFGL